MALAFLNSFANLAALKNFLTRIFLNSRYPLAIVAGLLLALSLPKLNLSGFAWAAPALILATAHHRRGADAFRIGYVAGLAYYLASLYWILLIPAGLYPILGWLALSAYLALYPAIWVWMTVGRIGTGTWLRRAFSAMAGAAIWVALEMIVSRLFSGFPWNLLGTSQYRLMPLVQIASITGIYGVSFLIVWVSLCLYSAARQILSQPHRRFAWQTEIILPFLVVAGLFAWGSGRLREPVAAQDRLRVTSIQPSIPQTMIWDTSRNAERFEQLMNLTRRGLTNQTDLLLWPEAALPEFTQESFQTITNLIQSQNVWMIFGADEVLENPERDSGLKYDVYNSAFLFNPDGRFVAGYRKRQLVIFGEYIPLVDWLPFIRYFTPITGGFTAGEKVIPFELNSTSRKDLPKPEIKTATLICFEDVFPHLVTEYVTDDTDFLINLTNDGWFGESAEQWQHAVAAVFRAIENDVPLIRSCNNGITCWIDGRGRFQQIFRDEAGSEYGVGVMTAEIPLLAPGEKRKLTFYTRHGDWFGWSCVGLTLMLLIIQLKQWKAAKS